MPRKAGWYQKANPEAAERKRKREAGECSRCTNPRSRGKTLCDQHQREQYENWKAGGGTTTNARVPFYGVAQNMNTRAQKRNKAGRVTAEDLQALAETTPTCVYCGTSLANVPTEFDHIIPYSRGGDNVIDNLRLICKRCNRAKLDGTEAEFLMWLQQIRNA